MQVLNLAQINQFSEFVAQGSIMVVYTKHACMKILETIPGLTL